MLGYGPVKKDFLAKYEKYGILSLLRQINRKFLQKFIFKHSQFFFTRLSINVGEHGVHEIIINSETAKRLRLKALTHTLKE